MLLYIHIPFCDSKCSYCAFNTYVDKFHLQKEYMHALKKQLLYELEHFDVTCKSIESVFIGGGTPSTIAYELYEPLFTLLKPYLKEKIEITAEANPNSATRVWLEGMYSLGVNRISFGVQSFDNDKLKLLNRAHNPQSAIKAIKNAHHIGFKNLSLDIIYGVQGDTDNLIENDITIAFSLPINHISAYALTIEEGTVFQKTPHMSNEKLEITQNLFKDITCKGFKQYEISNFGSYYSQHNIGYWDYKDYIGLGCGAVGFLKDTRFYPTSSLECYISNPLDIHEEKLSQEDIKIEKIFLGLRSFVGLNQGILNTKEQNKADLLVKEKKLTCKEGKYYNLDYLLSDELALFITT
ncbi:MAG: radical SAM family heme chaperone HemW [Campylobacterota bacterium]|nr:radical SAM family heme chaperone HemW [Campylobacterota bacterium]